MTIQEMKERKRELGLSNAELSQRSNVPEGTIQKIFSGKTVSPRRQTIEALEAVLAPSPRSWSVQPDVMAVHETAAAYAIRKNEDDTEESANRGLVKKDGEYTLDDYYAIPDERRVELIDGVIYDMAAPSVLHQKILGQLFLLFQECTEQHGGDCEVFLSPCDVQLDKDNRTMLQPDLFILCRAYDLSARSIYGAPDLTVEILSPSTRAKDMLLKLSKYYHAGVREYWIIDPENKQITVYNFSDNNFKPEVYSFDDTIPIHLSDGKCSIDFSRITKKLKR